MIKRARAGPAPSSSPRAAAAAAAPSSGCTPTTSARGRWRPSCRPWPTATSPQMANLWGTSAGPGGARPTSRPTTSGASRSCRRYLQQRDSPRSSSDAPDGPGTQPPRGAGRDPAPALHLDRAVHRRSSSSDGTWIVNQVDLTAAGNPAQPCVPGHRTRPPPTRSEPGTSVTLACYLTRSARAGCRRSPSDGRRRSAGRRHRCAATSSIRR